MRVKLEQKCSQEGILEAEVPQGVILAPYRYNIYTYNIPEITGTNLTIS